MTTAVLPHRVPLVGAANVRDLGGYPTADGRTVRRHQLFRADSLHRATTEDVAQLRSLGIRTVIDLRSAGEIERTGVLISEALGAEHVHLEVRHSKGPSRIPDRKELAGFDIVGLYRRYLELNGEQFAAALRQIAHPQSSPVLFHCFAGKDRTGVLAAVVLGLLGVDDESIATDYAATSETFERFRELVRSDEPPILDLEDVESIDPSLLDAQAETMIGLLAEVRERHGSLEALAGEWGIGADVVTALRDHLLQ